MFSAAVQAQLERCLAKEPAQRPSTIEAAWQSLRAALAACDPTAAASTTDVARAAATTTLGSAAGQARPRTATRGSWVAAALAIALAAAAAVVVIARRGASSSSSRDAPAVAHAGAGAAAPMDAGPDAAASQAAVVTPDAVPAPPDARLPAPDGGGQVAVRPEGATAGDPPRTGSGATPPRSPRAASRPPPDPGAPPPAAAPECALASFARVYDAADPGEAEVNAALARLRQCQTVLSSDQVNQIKRHLIAKLAR